MSEPFIGQLALVPYNFVPEGWAKCDGSILPVAQNQALFSLLGTQFGGSDYKNFALPKLEGPSEGLHWVIALRGIYPSRS
jgi:microcystin-dependent protein